MKLAAILGLAGLATACCGCASAYMTSRHDGEALMRGIIRAQGDGSGARLAVDVLSLDRGYARAWRSDPVGMLGATVVDIGTGYAIFAAGQQYGERRAAAEAPDPAPPAEPGDVNAQNDQRTGEGGDNSATWNIYILNRFEETKEAKP